MNVSEALLKRQSTRAFLPRDVSRETILEILDLAKRAPSGANTQPWSVAVVTDVAKTRVEKVLLEAFESGREEEADYTYYPTEWKEPFLQRRRTCGHQLYQSLNIQREDKESRRKQWAENYRAFRAPVLLLFLLDSSLATGSFMDTGMFLQSIMLLAVERGLATCPQAAFAEYPQTLRRTLEIPENQVVVCGMALGYPDPDHPINQYRTEREPASAFTRFFDS